MTTFFAECLPRLGIINLQVSLGNPSTDATVLITTSTSATSLLRHHGLETAILLPRDASNSDTIPFPSGQKVVTARIPCMAVKDPNELPQTALSAEDIHARWRSRNPGIYCVKCGRQVVKGGKISRWKELPSDSWIEYSDYWMCHPSTAADSHFPGHGHSHSHGHAHSVDHSQPPRQIPTITAIPGTGLIGLTSLLLHPDDLQSIQTVHFPYHPPLFRLLSLLLSFPPDSKKVSSWYEQLDADTKVLNQLFPILGSLVSGASGFVPVLEKGKKDLKVIILDAKLCIHESGEITFQKSQLVCLSENWLFELF
jgi:hypothetical protein